MAADVPRGFEPYAAERVPQSAVGSPGKDGRLDLAFATDADGRTRLVRDHARVPFHVSGSLDHVPPADGTAVYVQSPTGGVAQGDRHDVTVQVGRDATALVSTQSATKVQSMERNFAQADVDITVDEGGFLDYVPDATILYPNARFHQSVSLDLAEGATAIVREVIVPGRLARNEAFRFDRYASRIRARNRDGRLFEDSMHLQPAAADPRTVGILGNHAVVGTMYVVSPDHEDLPGLTDRLHERVAAESPAAAASTLPNDAGAWVRVLGERTEPVTNGLRGAWDEVRRALKGVPVPDLRRY